MPRSERDRLLARIAELHQTLAVTQSEDVHEAVRGALSDCENRLAELDVSATG
jgi:hypothetical protein